MSYGFITWDDEGQPVFVAGTSAGGSPGTNYPDDDFTTALTNNWEDINNITRDAGNFIHPTVKGDGYMDWKSSNDPMEEAGTKLVVTASGIRLPAWDNNPPGPPYPQGAPNAELGKVYLGLSRTSGWPILCRDDEGIPAIIDIGKTPASDGYALIVRDDEGTPVAQAAEAGAQTAEVRVYTDAQWVDDGMGGPQFQGRVIVRAMIDGVGLAQVGSWVNDPGDFRGSLGMELTNTYCKATWTETSPGSGTLTKTKTADSVGNYSGFRLTVGYVYPAGPGTPKRARVDDLTSAAT